MQSFTKNPKQKKTQNIIFIFTIPQIRYIRSFLFIDSLEPNSAESSLATFLDCIQTNSGKIHQNFSNSPVIFAIFFLCCSRIYYFPSTPSKNNSTALRETAQVFFFSLDNIHFDKVALFWILVCSCCIAVYMDSKDTVEFA